MSRPPLWVYKAVHQTLRDDPDLLSFVDDRRIVEEVARLVNVGQDWAGYVLRMLLGNGIVTFDDDGDPVIRAVVSDHEYLAVPLRPAPPTKKSGTKEPAPHADQPRRQERRQKGGRGKGRRGGSSRRPNHRR